MAAKSNQPPLIAVVGETASGKSRLALELAQRYNGEIICADSWTVRREVDIGTAKPTPAEQAAIPHHLLNIVGPCEDFTAAVFKRLANQAIHDITVRGKLPILVGGTGLYVDAVLFDYGFLPAAGKERRNQLNALTIQQLLSLIEAASLPLDGIDVRNKRRLVRLLETDGSRPTRHGLRPNTLILGIKLEREELEARIVSRVDQMLGLGLEAEARQLADTYGWECEALKGIGYKEWQGYFSGAQDLEQVRAAIIKGTKDLAKRQRTWFKRHEAIHWICKIDDAVDLLTTFLNK